MNLRRSVRRTISIAAAAFAGAAATLFFASPAAAHHVNTSGVAACAPQGGWTVTWTVVSPDDWGKDKYKLTSVSSTPGGSAFTDDLASVPTPFKDVDEAFVGTQHFPDSVTSATLTAEALWRAADGTRQEGGTKTSTPVQKPEDCPPPTEPPTEPPAAPAQPKAEFTDNCDETVTVKLYNTSDGTITYKVTGSDDVTIENPGDTATVTVKGDVEIVVSHGDWQTTHAWKDPGNCLPVTGSSLSGLIAAGTGLLAVGAGLVALFVVLRRRRARLSV